MTNVNIIMTATISDLIEEMGEWTPSTGYAGVSAWERLKARSIASDEADAAYWEEVAYVEEYRREVKAMRLNGTVTDDDEYALWDMDETMRYACPWDYMPEGFDRHDYIDRDDRI